ncbi:DUF2937 family protein [Shewanella sp. AS1]|uniref:DUF2937 family protein n=1 Tax=Shewanella sp. AS1 TaxID=2907626 RepID=UPI001F3EF1BD|nr:DUF2937 family protein [Shewanella sp. AS1]MCE9680161.1 DUF2937 family protein [Shewanella sp. AS1]
MKPIMDYLRLLLFICGVLIGIQVPAFVEQYGQSLAAHTSEAKMALAQFQRDADRFFDGDLAALIAHYRQNPDSVINAGAQSIESLHERYQLLDDALQRFNQSSYSGFQQLAFAPLEDVRSEVWQHFSHNIMLDGRAIAIGLILGLLISIFCELLLRGCVGLYAAGCRLLMPKKVKS